MQLLSKRPRATTIELRDPLIARMMERACAVEQISYRTKIMRHKRRGISYAVTVY